MTEATPSKKANFWARQIAPEVTRRQIIFDVLFGVIGPVVCLVVASGIFGSVYFLAGALANLQVFTYLGAGIGMIALVFWLALGRRLEHGQGFLAGILLLVALFAGLLDLLLVPLSLCGLVYIIGILPNIKELYLFIFPMLGLVASPAAFVYLRNGLRALHSSEKDLPKMERMGIPLPLIGGVLLVVMVPALAQWRATRIVNSAMHDILQGQGQAAQAGIETIRNAFWCSDFCADAIIPEYLREDEASRREYLAGAYRLLTGKDIQRQIQNRFGD